MAAGQTAPDTENGFKNYGSYHGSSVDTVNMMNGNWMFHAPFIPDAVQRGGFHYARIWHFVAMIGFPAFIPGHLIMVIIYGRHNFVAMVTG